MVDITAKEEVPQIVPHSTNTNITKKNSAWVFRTSVSERFYASVHAKYLAENAGKKVAYLFTNDGAAIGFAKDYKAFMKKTYNVDPVYEAQMQETDLDFRAHLLKIKSLGADVLAIGGQIDAISRISQQSIEVGIPVEGAPRRGLGRLERAGAGACRRRGRRPSSTRPRSTARTSVRWRRPSSSWCKRSTRSAARTMTSARPTRPRRSSSWRCKNAKLDADRRLAQGRPRGDPRRARQHQELHRSGLGSDQLLRRADAAVPRRQQDRHPRRVHQGRQGLRHARAGARLVRA